MSVLPLSFGRRLAAAALILSTAACSQRPALLSADEQQAKTQAMIADGGYFATGRHEVIAAQDHWRRAADIVDVSVLVPAMPGQYPLIVYLPGLGEQADAGKLWREYWAKAGYVVVSLQPKEIADALIQIGPPPAATESGGFWPDFGGRTDESDEEDDEQRGKRRAADARASELRYIGHQLFAVDALQKRLDLTLWALEQCLERSRNRQGLYAKADPQRLLLAGYDLGAQTVAALIGERNGPAPASAPPTALAAVLLSPSADPALGTAAQRYQDIQRPFLAVTSDIDHDPYAISSPQIRTAIWQYAPAGGKWLLQLKNAEHRLLAGTGFALPGAEHGHDRGRGRNGPPAGGPPGYTGSAGFGGPGGPGGGHGGPPGAGRGTGGPDDEDGEPGGASAAIAAIYCVTLAFFDDIAKQDNFAELWLRQNAGPWLGKTGRLQWK
ncbi:hypothetical protein [Methylomonas sp. HYX-M1]|uniref:hypothetical protein n=1 Tax=Methylomonas sp. HYX-M1 TaxID=3139307 RepID=UPI00345BB9CA